MTVHTLGGPHRPHLRLAVPPEAEPIADDETARTQIQEHWKAAKAEFSTLLGAMAPHNLRWLITGPTTDRARGLMRGDFRGMASAAREIATSALRLADHLDRAAAVYDRREGGRS